ncbi:hypothetical protein L3X38_026426 [Prunus dulcis]|uniref:No apical meristem-associated C-terminal domain-containing protein n=1 Tax=Prunus dulcis TaxID=3755 RepID=A0AAD4VKY3_PRUDU|nr:hypothetical protein L3X38_026426 [Prunus dulcis]
MENDLGISELEQQTYQAIAYGFKTINQQCSLWKACLTKANTNPQSGSNLHDVDVYAKTIFHNDNKPPNGPFNLYHAWEILKDCPKWNNINKPPAQCSFGASASMVNLDNDVDDITMPSPRLEGRDKQKVAKKKKRSAPPTVLLPFLLSSSSFSTLKLLDVLYVSAFGQLLKRLPF